MSSPRRAPFNRVTVPLVQQPLKHPWISRSLRNLASIDQVSEHAHDRQQNGASRLVPASGTSATSISRPCETQ